MNDSQRMRLGRSKRLTASVSGPLPFGHSER